MAGIVWLASYPKSGNTWLRAFLHNFLRDPERSHDINKLTDLTAGESMTHLYRAQDPALDRHLTDERVRELRPLVHRTISRSSPDTVLVKTHNALVEDGGYPLISLDLTAGAIYIVRNPLDVVISHSHHYGADLDATIDLLASVGTITNPSATHVAEYHGSWSEHVHSWTSRPSPGLHVMRYEDMLIAPYKSFAAVDRFLQLGSPRDRLERAIRRSSFKVLQEQEKRRGFREKTDVAERFFRAGKAGQWRTVLSQAQVDRVVEAHRDQMARFGYLPE